MTQEDKQLLLKDLSARLSYGVIVRYQNKDIAENFNHILDSVAYHMAELFPTYDGFQMSIIPYLRPMSSMTEEELRDFAKIKFEDDALWEIVEFPKKEGFKGFINVKCKNKNNGDTWIFQVNTRTPLETYYGIDWLLKHHFDFRGLIEKGLALEAPEDMYK